MKSLSKNASKEQVVIFLHIHKTAGTTLRYIIQYQYNPSAIYELYGSASQCVDQLKNLSEPQRRKIKYVSSHLGFGVHEFLLQPCTYITFLRNPIDRTVSFYYYLQRRGGIPQDLTLKDFVQSNKIVHNGMTNYLAGDLLKYQPSDLSIWNEVNSQNPDKTKFELAKRNLKEHFKFIGLAERFDESLLLLKRIMGWKIPLYEKSNVTKKRPLTRDLSKDTLNVIEKFNEFDIQLYEYAQEIFEELINQQDPSFQTELEKFKQANESSITKPYFRVRTLYNRVINKVYKEFAS